MEELFKKIVTSGAMAIFMSMPQAEPKRDFFSRVLKKKASPFSTFAHILPKSLYTEPFIHNV